MKFLKTLLYKLAGKRNYLKIVSSLFFLFYRTGLLKLFNKFDTHYLAPSLVKRGWVIIDIGANLGYYSVILGKATGEKGKLYAVEPVDDYRIILRRNIKNLPWVEVVPYALGVSSGRARMAIPGNDKTRHGLTRITGEAEKPYGSQFSPAGSTVTAENEPVQDSGWNVEIKSPAELFGNIGTVHYIKCDIEGYEAKLFPALMPLVTKSRPVIQIEIARENRSLIRDLMIPLGYNSFKAAGRRLTAVDTNDAESSDVIFIPEEITRNYSELINN
ncbi:MAG: FkbM family methyltransferase [Bacteroidales bacterium]|nr:FkbM family methyltransferase [Bacteroidales bacterium]